jgi:hypothetical protein
MSDIEKQESEIVKGQDVERSPSTTVGNIGEFQRVYDLQHSNKILRSLRRGEEWLDEKMGVETQGIDRVLEENKDPPSLLNVSNSLSNLSLR